MVIVTFVTTTLIGKSVACVLAHGKISDGFFGESYHSLLSSKQNQKLKLKDLHDIEHRGKVNDNEPG